jgi:K+-transporting ATPase ATPase C chain
MNAHLRANLWLLILSVGLGSIFYPSILLVIGQTVFHDKAEGSLVYDKDGKTVIGSKLIAQPFSGEGYFQPRPSAVSYNSAGSGASNWGANNYLLRERVARQLGPIVKYRGGPQAGEPVGPDVETWFQKDQYQGQPGIVAQWAAAHSTVAANWVKGDDLNKAYVTAWMNEHPDAMAEWKTANPDNAAPNPEDFAGVFFAGFSKAHPGKFPSAVETAGDDGKTEKNIQPVNQGSDIQGIFFDMWLSEHTDADLAPVPADMVMASGSGLDPHITLKNALYQLDRVAARRAADSGREASLVQSEIEELLHQHAHAPLGGIAGVKLVNVLEINLLLRDRYK